MGALGLLTSTFYFIPKATLAGLIMTAMFFMIDFDVVSLLWRTKRKHSYCSTNCNHPTF